MTPRFEWKAPDGRDQIFLISAPEIIIGRTSVADLVVPSQHVSRRHAKVVAVPDGYQIVDLGSTYGTFVNDQRVDKRLLQHGDRVSFGKEDSEFQFLVEDAAPNHTEETTKIVQRSLQDLNRVLPSATSDLEKILCVLDFQYQWNQVFTPDNALDQILESALKISGAERAFIMVRKGDQYGYGAGLDGRGRHLSERNFQTSRSIVREVVSSGKPVFMVEGIHKNFAEQASIVAMKLRAIACIPLVGIPTEAVSPEILGILYLDSTKAMHSMSGLDQKILNKLAVEAGNVLERVEMIKSIEARKTLERDLALAEETQRAILPHELPQLPHLKLRAFSRPTRYVGGDFYDFEVMKSGTLIGMLADVSGKGVAASLLSAMLSGCLQLLLRDGASPERALDRLNKFLVEKSFGKFATMFVFSILPDGKGQYVNAGHNTAYLYRKSKNAIEELASNGLIVGAFDFATFEVAPFEMEPGDVIIAYSDGLTEAENLSGTMYGEQRLKDIFLQCAPLGAEKLHEAILREVEEFTRGTSQTDDITIVIAERA